MEQLPAEQLYPPTHYDNHEPTSILKLVKDIGSQIAADTDFSHVRLPATFSYPFSMLELIAIKRFRGMEWILEYKNMTDPIEKLLLITKWYMACITHDGFCKKPWNPILGETFIARDEYDTYFFSEQVSHHPPISAFYFENTKERFRSGGHMQMSIKYTGNSVVAETGGKMYMFIGDDEYKIEKFAPTLYTKNLLVGSHRNEYSGDVKLVSSFGYDVILRFKRLSALSLSHNNLNGVHGIICRHVTHNKIPTPIIEFEGHWDKTIVINKTRLLYDYDAIKNPVISELRHSSQKNKSSRLVWQKANQALLNKDYATADIEKAIIEDSQRAERDAMLLEEEEYVPLLFDKNDKEQIWKIKDSALELFKHQEVHN